MEEKALIEKRNDNITRAEEVLNKAKEEERELTEEEAQTLTELRDENLRIDKTIELKGDFEKMDNITREETKVVDVNNNEERALEEERAFADYIRGVVSERANNLTPASNSAGVTIPVTIVNKIIKKVYDICPILERSSKYNMKGTIEIPYYDVDTTTITVAWATEFQELESHIGKFTNISLTGHLAGALSLISLSLVNNSQFDIVAFVVEQMALSIRRFIENVLLNGSGDVEGLSTLTNKLVAASATAITSDEVIKLKDRIKDIFQNDSIWIMSRNTRTALRLLKDQVGRYLLQDDITSPFGTTLLGKPVYVSDNMPDMEAGKNAIYYGDMKGLATKFSEDMNIQVLREKYITQHALGVVGWLEFDSKVEDAQKIAALKMAGSPASL